MWITFIFGAVTGAVFVSSFHRIGLWGIVLPLILLILIEMNRKWTDTADSRTRCCLQGDTAGRGLETVRQKFVGGVKSPFVERCADFGHSKDRQTGV